jgi:hypothetical protein
MEQRNAREKGREAAVAGLRIYATWLQRDKANDQPASVFIRDFMRPSQKRKIGLMPSTTSP